MLISRKIKVLMLLPNLVSAGGQQAVLNLYRSLPPNRFELSLLVHEKTGSFSQGLDESINVHFVSDRDYRRTDLPKYLAATVHHARQADIVLAGLEGRASFLGLLAAKFLRKPVVAWLHIDWSPFIHLVSWRQRLSLSLYGYADRIVTCSKGVADNFAKDFGLPRTRLHPIYNGLPSQKIRQKALEPLPDSIQQIFEQPTVLTVGRLDHQKAQEYLIAAHALLRAKGIQHNLAIVGEGGLLSALKQQALDLGVSDTVHFLGFQQNPYKFMNHATAFAFSSRFEGFGLVLVEAMLCGLPTVSTDCPSGPREVLGDGQYGVLVESENAQALADGLEQILCNPARRQQLSNLALIRGEAFDEQDTTQQWTELLEELYQQSAPNLPQPVESQLPRTV